ALLALLACLGLAQLGHETTPALAQLFFVSHMFYGVAALPFRRIGAVIALVVGAVGMALSGAPTIALLLGVGSSALVFTERRRDAFRQADDAAEGTGYSAAAAWVIAGITLLAVLLAARLHLAHWHIALPGHRSGSSTLGDIRSLAKLVIWFTWPAWPLALWTLWRWRRQLNARHVAIPLLFMLVPLAATVTTDFSERALLLGLPAFATLAAFALPTFRRSAAAIIDWFTLLFFSGSALIIWVIWIAIQTGVPAKPAANVARLAPGFVPSFSLAAFVFAVLATVAWCWLVRWRTGRHRAALWKTLVLPAGGAALCWMLLMTLWLPLLDYARSYVPQVNAIAERVGRPACISELALSRQHIAALRYHGQFELSPLVGGEACPWLLISPEAIATLHNIVSMDQWRLSGTLRRPTSAADDLLLFQRITP
ncbi:MAG: hypothetical protein H7340_20210, partial [Variovorax sp.]|nr:hypothetical protein [Variovorax sp.]